MTREDVETFIKTQSQLEELYTEISILSKKSQNDALNKFKLKFVNQLLDEANQLLGDKNKPFNDFSSFDEEDMPTNSDVALILSQYLSCLENSRTENTMQYVKSWYWVIDGERSDIRTNMPKKIKGE
jgi:hypothetical protein